LLDGQLVLISPMTRSRGSTSAMPAAEQLIYALADASWRWFPTSIRVVLGGAVNSSTSSSSFIFVRSTGESSAGLDGLRKKGALPWPNPQDVDSFEEVFNVAASTASPQVGFSLFSNDGPSPADALPMAPIPVDSVPAPQAENEPSAPVDVISDEQSPPVTSEKAPPVTTVSVAKIGEPKESLQLDLTPDEVLFAAVHTAIKQLLIAPMKDAQVAAALNVSNAQAKAWLQRLVDEGVLEKQKKPAGYIVKQNRLFE